MSKPDRHNLLDRVLIRVVEEDTDMIFINATVSHHSGILKKGSIFKFVSPPLEAKSLYHNGLFYIRLFHVVKGSYESLVVDDFLKPLIIKLEVGHTYHFRTDQRFNHRALRPKELEKIQPLLSGLDFGLL